MPMMPWVSRLIIAQILTNWKPADIRSYNAMRTEPATANRNTANERAIVSTNVTKPILLENQASGIMP